jgi:hypothetical protein
MMMMKHRAAHLTKRMRATLRRERRGKRGKPKGSEAVKGRANL